MEQNAVLVCLLYHYLFNFQFPFYIWNFSFLFSYWEFVISNLNVLFFKMELLFLESELSIFSKNVLNNPIISRHNKLDKSKLVFKNPVNSCQTDLDKYKLVLNLSFPVIIKQTILNFSSKLLSILVIQIQTSIYLS